MKIKELYEKLSEKGIVKETKLNIKLLNNIFVGSSFLFVFLYYLAKINQIDLEGLSYGYGLGYEALTLFFSILFGVMNYMIALVFITSTKIDKKETEKFKKFLKQSNSELKINESS